MSSTLRAAGLSHAPFDHPGDDTLRPIWARLRGASHDEMMAIAAGEIFAGANALAALPKLLECRRLMTPWSDCSRCVEFAG